MAYIKKIKLPDSTIIYDIYDTGAARKEELAALKVEIKSEILGSAPEELDTLEELAKALGEDENFSATILRMLGERYTKTEIDEMEFITIEDIDTICGGFIEYAEDVMF